MAATDGDIWGAVAKARDWLDEQNGRSTHEMTLRILKITEEAGEAVAAWIGAIGQNPRKGRTHRRQDVADELGDVAFTALVAAASLGFDPEPLLTRVAAKIQSRLPPASASTAPDTPDPPPQTLSRQIPPRPIPPP
jgi:NTP pyrophosphatase (non-canonical NTP hydrolase)